MAFYVALAMFRIAAILAGVGARAALGNASSAVARQVALCSCFYAALSVFCIAAILTGVGARVALGNASTAVARQVAACFCFLMICLFAFSKCVQQSSTT